MSEDPSVKVKVCSVCGEAKPITEFYKAPGCVDGRRGDCRTCFQAKAKAKARRDDDPDVLEAARERTRRWRAENPERYAENRRRFKESGGYKRSLRQTHLKKKYNLTLEQYDRMLEAQGGGCKICGRPPGDIALHVDHCHITGRVRGLLCFPCNAALGHLQHDPDIIETALVYVGTHWRLEDLKSLARRSEN
jgi:hypothetical protein